jgi:hypothetical protein
MLDTRHWPLIDSVFDGFNWEAGGVLALTQEGTLADSRL